MRTAPDYVQFYPTLRCNRSCDFCFNRSLPHVADMAFADFRRMVEKLKSIGVRTLDIMGGEPTLHGELPQMINVAVLEGLGVNLSSNATDLIQLADILDRHPQVTVGVSVNERGANLDVEELIRRRRLIVKVVGGRNIDEALVGRLLSLKPKKLYVLFRDALDAGQLRETVPFDRFLNAVQTRFDPARVGTVSCSGFLPDFEQYPELLKTRCPAGTTKLGILPDGSVYPCNLFFGQRAFLLGNILADPFEAIWRRPALAFFRTYAGNQCPRTSCVLHAKCHGGCPAHSYALAGSRSAPDPRCVPG